MSLAGCQIIPIDLNFHLQKGLEIFYKTSADKIQFINYKEVNPPCLMPIRVKRVSQLDTTSPTWEKCQSNKLIGIHGEERSGTADELTFFNHDAEQLENLTFPEFGETISGSIF